MKLVIPYSAASSFLDFFPIYLFNYLFNKYLSILTLHEVRYWAPRGGAENIGMSSGVDSLAGPCLHTLSFLPLHHDYVSTPVSYFP